MKEECRKVVKKSFAKELPVSVNYDDIKSYLLAMESCEDLQSWIIFRITIQQKINRSREVIKSIPELKAKWQKSHKQKKERKCKEKWGKKGFRMMQCFKKKKEFFKRKFEEKFDESI